MHITCISHSTPQNVIKSDKNFSWNPNLTCSTSYSSQNGPWEFHIRQKRFDVYLQTLKVSVLVFIRKQNVIILIFIYIYSLQLSKQNCPYIPSYSTIFQNKILNIFYHFLKYKYFNTTVSLTINIWKSVKPNSCGSTNMQVKKSYIKYIIYI